MNIGAHIIVKGLVQGVGFRWFVEREAKKLGLVGYVRNLPTGQVEIEVEGDRSLIEELMAKVKVGNRLARVIDLDINWLEARGRYTNFNIIF